MSFDSLNILRCLSTVTVKSHRFDLHPDFQLRNEADEIKGGEAVRHCNSVFKAEDIWFLSDLEEKVKRKLYIASCPICQKNIALYSYFDLNSNEYFEKYYYSGGAIRIKKELKAETVATMLGFKDKYKMPFGFKYGINKEIKRNGKIVEIRQFACDFQGNKILVKQIKNGKI